MCGCGKKKVCGRPYGDEGTWVGTGNGMADCPAGLLLALQLSDGFAVLFTDHHAVLLLASPQPCSMGVERTIVVWGWWKEQKQKRELEQPQQDLEKKV